MVLLALRFAQHFPLRPLDALKALAINAGASCRIAILAAQFADALGKAFVHGASCGHLFPGAAQGIGKLLLFDNYVSKSG